jgi:hypothetical protein
MAGNHPNNKTPERAKESALSRAFTSTLLRFRHTERSISYSPLICPPHSLPCTFFRPGTLGTAAISSALLAMCSGVPLSAEDGSFYFSNFFGNSLGVLRQTPGKPFATQHQFGTKTRCWSGCFPEWRSAKSNGITMG